VSQTPDRVVFTFERHGEPGPVPFQGGGGGATWLGDLYDVDLSGIPAGGDLLTYDGVDSEWQCKPPVPPETITTQRERYQFALEEWEPSAMSWAFRYMEGDTDYHNSIVKVPDHWKSLTIENLECNWDRAYDHQSGMNQDFPTVELWYANANAAALYDFPDKTARWGTMNRDAMSAKVNNTDDYCDVVKLCTLHTTLIRDGDGGTTSAISYDGSNTSLIHSLQNYIDPSGGGAGTEVDLTDYQYNDFDLNGILFIHIAPLIGDILNHFLNASITLEVLGETETS
jgi:hypothetical protein